MFSEKITWKTV